ncbi:MAG: phosphoribosyltransferase family protein [Patescibacteria group bacterium]
MSLKNISFPAEDTHYICPTWDEMNDLAFKISQAIIKDKHKFDRIVTLAKGGWPLTRSMVDFLNVDKVASIGVKFYRRGIYKKLAQPEIYQDLPEPIKDENILLFDDVADSGGSLEFVKRHLEVQGSHTITTATLFYKPWSTFKPDYYGHETDAWIAFPYDAVHDGMFLLAKNWQAKGLSKPTIISRLTKMGINQSWIKYYLK